MKKLGRIEVENMQRVVEVGPSTTSYVHLLVARNLPEEGMSADILGKLEIDLVDINDKVEKEVVAKLRIAGAERVAFHGMDVLEYFEQNEPSDLVFVMNLASRGGIGSGAPFGLLVESSRGSLHEGGLLVIEDHLGPMTRRPLLRDSVCKNMERSGFEVEVGDSDDGVLESRLWNNRASFHLRGHKRER